MKAKRSTRWLKERDAKRLAENLVLAELSELAIKFAAAGPQRRWGAEEVAIILRKRIARRRKLGPCVTVPEDELPAGAMRLRVPKGRRS